VRFSLFFLTQKIGSNGGIFPSFPLFFRFLSFLFLVRMGQNQAEITPFFPPPLYLLMWKIYILILLFLSISFPPFFEYILFPLPPSLRIILRTSGIEIILFPSRQINSMKNTPPGEPFVSFCLSRSNVIVSILGFLSPSHLGIRYRGCKAFIFFFPPFLLSCFSFSWVAWVDEGAFFFPFLIGKQWAI